MFWAAATLSPPTTVKADPMGRAAALSPEKELRTFLARYEPKMGSGNIVRHLRLEAATDLDKPDIKRFIRHAITTARPPFSGSARLRTVIRAVSKKQRPRRPA